MNDNGNYINHTNPDSLNRKSSYTSTAIYKATPRMLTGPVLERVYHDKNWMKVINVRHPFERLHSGWQSKFNRTLADASRFKKMYEDTILGYNKVELRLFEMSNS